MVCFGGVFMRHSPLYYGYLVLFAGTLGAVFTGPGQTGCIGTTITSVTEEYGLERTEVSSLYLYGTL